MIKAILFDLDGVLVNSEVYDQQINTDFIEEHGYKTDPAIFRIWIGGNEKTDYWSILKNMMHPDDDYETFREQFEAFHRVKRWVVPFVEYMFPETQPVIRELHEKGYKLACCSSSSPDYIDRALTDMEIKQYFDVIVSGHDFEHGKPAPDIYLYARDRFGLKSGECLVVEDSPIGITAGKQAEMTVVARRDHVFGMDQSAADYHVDSLEELLPIVDRL